MSGIGFERYVNSPRAGGDGEEETPIAKTVSNFLKANPLFEPWKKDIQKSMGDHVRRSNDNDGVIQGAIPESFNRTVWTVTGKLEEKYEYIPKHFTTKDTDTYGSIKRMMFGFICRTQPHFLYTDIYNGGTRSENINWRYDDKYGHLAFFSEPYIIYPKIEFSVTLHIDTPGVMYLEPIALLMSAQRYNLGKSIDITKGEIPSSEPNSPLPLRSAANQIRAGTLPYEQTDPKTVSMVDAMDNNNTGE